MENAAWKALTRLGMYFSTVMFRGGRKGLQRKGETPLLPGVKICRSGMASIMARYSVFVGSMARKGMPFS